MTKLQIKDELLKLIAEYAEQAQRNGEREAGVIYAAEYTKMQEVQQAHWNKIIEWIDKLYDFNCDHSCVYYSKDHDNFYCEACHKGMGNEYYKNHFNERQNYPKRCVMDNSINSNTELQKVLDSISFVNTVLDFKWKFEYRPVEVLYCGDGDALNGWLVWVSFERPDTITGKVGRGRGRDEIIWRGTSLSGVVKTCWLLVELMVRHELMEGFRWEDARIFNPHNTVQALAAVQKQYDQK